MALGFGDKLLPPLGPFPLRDTVGMTAAVFFVARSLMPGRKQGALLYGTTCKMTTFFDNVYQASAAGSDPKALVGLNKGATRQTADPTKSIARAAPCSVSQRSTMLHGTHCKSGPRNLH